MLLAGTEVDAFFMLESAQTRPQHRFPPRHRVVALTINLPWSVVGVKIPQIVLFIAWT